MSSNLPRWPLQQRRNAPSFDSCSQEPFRSSANRERPNRCSSSCVDWTTVHLLFDFVDRITQERHKAQHNACSGNGQATIRQFKSDYSGFCSACLTSLCGTSLPFGGCLCQFTAYTAKQMVFSPNCESQRKCNIQHAPVGVCYPNPCFTAMGRPTQPPAFYMTPGFQKQGEFTGSLR